MKKQQIKNNPPSYAHPLDKGDNIKSQTPPTPLSFRFPPQLRGIKGEQKKAFTLVELIIVITILAILATIAFVSFSSYTASSRDTKRIVTIESIAKGLNIFQTQTGKYPNIDNQSSTGIINGDTLSFVGEVGENVSKLINISPTPKDPVSGNNFKYATSFDNKYFQVAGTQEKPVAEKSIINQMYANARQAKVLGNYNGLLKKENKLYNLPSLLYTGSGYLISNDTYFIVDKGQNIPYKITSTDPDNSVQTSVILSQITGTSSVTLTGVALPSTPGELKANIDSLVQILGYPGDKIGQESFGTQYFVGSTSAGGSSNSSGGGGGGSSSGGPVVVTCPENPTAEEFFEFSGGEITGYLPAGPKDVVIPCTVGGESVTSIGEYAFSNQALTSVVISNTVNSIGTAAFADNQIISIIFPNSVSNIGDDSFRANQLTNIVISNTVTTIGINAFRWNNISNLVIPNSVTYIGNGAFWSNNISNLVIPNSVTYIGNGAFNSNVLPDDQAFIYKRNSDGTIDNTVVVSYGGINKNPVIPNTVNSIGTAAFADNQLISIIFPNSLTTISSTAFSSNQLTSITIPNAVTSIGEYAFSDNELTSITIPNSVTSIGEATFFSNQLTSVFIPNSVTSIGDDAFLSNGPSQNSNSITTSTWSPGNGGTWNLSGDDWVKQ